MLILSNAMQLRIVAAIDLKSVAPVIKKFLKL